MEPDTWAVTKHTETILIQFMKQQGTIHWGQQSIRLMKELHDVSDR
jgi:hypothetical protein